VLAHHRGDRVLADRPACLVQVSGDPRRPVSAPVRSEQAPDLGRQQMPTRCPAGLLITASGNQQQRNQVPIRLIRHRFTAVAEVAVQVAQVRGHRLKETL
jgi:hypothetical protein